VAAPIVADPGQDFPRRYQDVLAKAEPAENGPVRGTMVVLPAADDFLLPPRSMTP